MLENYPKLTACSPVVQYRQNEMSRLTRPDPTLARMHESTSKFKQELTVAVDGSNHGQYVTAATYSSNQ